MDTEAIETMLTTAVRASLRVPAPARPAFIARHLVAAVDGEPTSSPPFDLSKADLQSLSQEMNELGLLLTKAVNAAAKVPSRHPALMVADYLERGEQPMLKALSSFDDGLVEALEVKGIRFLRVAWLQQQPSNYRIQRRQDLEALETTGQSPLLSAIEAVALIRSCSRAVGVLTYGTQAGPPAKLTLQTVQSSSTCWGRTVGPSYSINPLILIPDVK